MQGYLITSRTDQYYLTGFDGEDGAALAAPFAVRQVLEAASILHGSPELLLRRRSSHRPSGLTILNVPAAAGAPCWV